MWLIKTFLILFIIAIISKNNKINALKILGIFPMPAKSHFVMGEELMKVLARQGHQVDVVNHFPQKKPYPNYTDISLAGSLPTTQNNITISDTKNLTALSFFSFIEHGGIEPCNLLSSHPGLKILLNKPKDSYDVVIVWIFAAHCYIAFGQHFNAPVIGLLPSKMHDWLYAPFGNPFNTAYMGSLFASYTQEMTFFERLKNTFLANIITLQFNYYIEAECNHVEKYFGRKLSSIQELYDDISLLFVNSHYSINEIKPQTPDVIDIGGIHVDSKSELTEDLKKWLDESKEGCIYISFGSMVKIETLPDDKLEAFYQMFNKISPVRVLMKIADPKLLPPNLPKNVKTSSWLPQIAVLKHENTKVFVTHGGLMGTMEAIAWGVPLVGIPLFGDQHTNIKTYAKKKIAIALELETIDANSFTNAVTTVLKNPDYRKNMEKLSSLFMDRPMTPAETVIYWVEYVAKYGNRLKSPATKLTWWQFYLLDVYAFILASFVIIIFIFKKILGIFYHLLCSQKIKSKKNE